MIDAFRARALKAQERKSGECREEERDYAPDKKSGSRIPTKHRAEEQGESSLGSPGAARKRYGSGNKLNHRARGETGKEVCL